MNFCESILSCYLLYLNVGVKSGGGVGDLLSVQTLGSPMYWIRFINDMIFYITVILLIMNMINGIIISTFSSLREEKEETEWNLTHVCFICSIQKIKFDKNKKSFSDHTTLEHNVENYLMYLVSLKLKYELDLNADETCIVESINNNDVKVFPIYQCLTLGEIEEDDDIDN